MNQHTCFELYSKYQESVPDVLSRLKNGEKLASIARSYGFERNSFSRWLDKNGYRKKTKTRGVRNTPDVIAKAHELCVSGMSIVTAANELHVPRWSLYRDLRITYGYKPLHDGKKPVDDYYFHEIDSYEKAYWLGFFAADGYNSGDGHIEFCLKDEDKYAVEYFKKAIKSKHVVACKKTRGFINWRISVNSKQMSSDLKKLGYDRDKTYKQKFPKIKESYCPHFIRGYLDGDAHIQLASTGRLMSVSITTASQEFAYDLQCFLSNIDINCKIKTENRRSNCIIYFGAIEGRKLLDYCYKDSTEETRLIRKYAKYLKEFNCRPRPKTMKKTLD